MSCQLVAFRKKPKKHTIVPLRILFPINNFNNLPKEENKGVIKMAIPILYREELKEYDFGGGHPFLGKRIGEFIDYLKIKIPQKNFEFIKPKLAENSDLELIHSKEYIDFVERFYQALISGKELPKASEISQFLSTDNLPGKNPGNLILGAKFIVGAAKMAGELVWEGKYEKVISFGGLHHAKRNYGEGFCL